MHVFESLVKLSEPFYDYDFLTCLRNIDKIKTAIIKMCLNQPSCEVKNQLTVYKVRWF